MGWGGAVGRAGDAVDCSADELAGGDGEDGVLKIEEEDGVGVVVGRGCIGLQC
jgi:hypothetical protein